jgi:WD40 repeat protein
MGHHQPRGPQQIDQPLTAGSAPVTSVAFSPDRDALAAGDAAGTTQLWNLNVMYAIERVCATTGGLTPQQWNQYVPQLGYQPSCAG